jgi:hypothetical protein
MNLTTEMLRAMAHRLVDQALDEIEGAIREELLAAAARPAKSAAPRARAPHSTPPAGEAAPLVAMAVYAYEQNGTKVSQLQISLPLAVAERAGLAVGDRVRCTVLGHTLAIERSDAGVKLSRSGNHAIKAQPGGAAYGLRAKQPATRCAWHLDLDHRLVVDLPAWWPRASAGPAAAKPPAPPATRAAKPATHAPIEGGELIPEDEREFRCHTCGAKLATVTCNDCDGLYCAGCWASHRLGHRARAVARQAQALHA